MWFYFTKVSRNKVQKQTHVSCFFFQKELLHNKKIKTNKLLTVNVLTQYYTR